MGKSAPSPPPAPDPAATAAAQGAINKETAIAQARLNQVDEYTPYGSSIYEKTGNVNDGIDQMKRTTTLDPAQQAIVENQNTIDLNLSALAGEQLGLEFIYIDAGSGALFPVSKKMIQTIKKHF